MIRWAVLVTAALACTPLPAAAWTGRVTWTTWLRAGPGADYKVIDEVWGGTQLNVLGCAEGWCRTLSDGAVAYIPADLVTQAEPAVAGPPGDKQPCFDARREGYKDGETFSYCPR